MPKPDDRDLQILKTRQASYDAKPGARVGDWFRLANGEMRRFTHDWEDSLQTTCVDGESGSFYLGMIDGMWLDAGQAPYAYVSYSGSLDPSIPRNRLEDTGETRPGRVWFFHGDFQMANNGVEFEIPFRVFKERTDADS